VLEYSVSLWLVAAFSRSCRNLFSTGSHCFSPEPPKRLSSAPPLQVLSPPKKQRPAQSGTVRPFHKFRTPFNRTFFTLNVSHCHLLISSFLFSTCSVRALPLQDCLVTTDPATVSDIFKCADSFDGWTFPYFICPTCGHSNPSQDTPGIHTCHGLLHSSRPCPGTYSVSKSDARNTKKYYHRLYLDFEQKEREEREHAAWIDKHRFDGSVKRGGAGIHGRGGYANYSQSRQDLRPSAKLRKQRH
jgi:hypothetical protein